MSTYLTSIPTLYNTLSRPQDQILIGNVFALIKPGWPNLVGMGKWKVSTESNGITSNV